jgi:hypothetical protein
MLISDPEGDPTTYTIDFGDGSPLATGSGTSATVLQHRYDVVGPRYMVVTVDDGTSQVRRTELITPVLAEPLVANAGDNRVAVVGEAVRFDAIGSRPLALIDNFEWTFPVR